MSLTGSTGSVVHIYGLTGLAKLAKPSVKAHLPSIAICLMSQDSARV